MQGLCKEKEKDRGRWFLFLLSCLLSINTMVAQSDVKAKNITYQCKNEQLSKALRQVERLSEYYRLQFAYEDVEKYTVSVTLKDATVQTALSKLLQNTDLNYEINDRFVHVFRQAADSERQLKKSSGAIKGQVIDEQGEPLIGVTVRVVGTKEGTITDFDGNFSVGSGDKKSVKLLLSYVGKNDKEVEASAGKLMKIVMEDNSQILEDVVVTGYQTLSRERVTGSFDKVNQEMLAARPSADISSALQGMVAGMQATEKEDGSVDFMIRGTSSLYANTSPLVVVDGFPIEGSFSSINPNDVESVTVLKDAAAASIWGARSANGVIVVTTKRAKKNSKLNVDVQTFWRIGTTPDIDYITAQADSRTTVDYELASLKNGWSSGKYTPGFTSLRKYLSLAMEYYYANMYRGMSEEEMNVGLESSVIQTTAVS